MILSGNKNQRRLLEELILCVILLKSKFEPIFLGNDKNGDWYHNIDYVAKNVDLTKLDYFTHASSVFLFNSNDQIPKKLKTTIVSSQIFAKFGTK